MLLIGALATAFGATAAQATVLTPTGDPLPGSTFQGADGDQDDASPLVDWQSLNAGWGVRHSPDPNEQDDAFEGGSKEEEPGAWALDVAAGGVKPGKSNIRDAWSALRRPQATRGFDLLVNGQDVLPAAGDGASTTISVPPGVYDVSEAAAPGTNAADYRSSVECRRNPTRIGRRRSGASFEDLPLSAGDRATCTFRNIRPGSPAIAIRKVGPVLAQAGDTLRYAFFVTNPGDVPFAEDAVQVSDPVCDAPPPALRDKRDASPGTLDPGDTWIYGCSNGTTDRGAECEPSRVDNTGTVAGSANGTTVVHTDSISTVLLCPDRPQPPMPEPAEPPTPDSDGPVTPGPSCRPGRPRRTPGTPAWPASCSGRRRGSASSAACRA